MNLHLDTHALVVRWWQKKEEEDRMTSRHFRSISTTAAGTCCVLTLRRVFFKPTSETTPCLHFLQVAHMYNMRVCVYIRRRIILLIDYAYILGNRRRRQRRQCILFSCAGCCCLGNRVGATGWTLSVNGILTDNSCGCSENWLRTMGEREKIEERKKSRRIYNMCCCCCCEEEKRERILFEACNSCISYFLQHACRANWRKLTRNCRVSRSRVQTLVSSSCVNGVICCPSLGGGKFGINLECM